MNKFTDFGSFNPKKDGEVKINNQYFAASQI
jgi:hypothetical protein